MPLATPATWRTPRTGCELRFECCVLGAVDVPAARDDASDRIQDRGGVSRSRAAQVVHRQGRAAARCHIAVLVAADHHPQPEPSARPIGGDDTAVDLADRGDPSEPRSAANSDCLSSSRLNTITRRGEASPQHRPYEAPAERPGPARYQDGCVVQEASATERRLGFAWLACGLRRIVPAHDEAWSMPARRPTTECTVLRVMSVSMPWEPRRAPAP